MSLHFNLYSIILLVSGVAAAIVGIVLFQRGRPAITWFALMMHASAIWAIAYSFELSSSTLPQMLLWIDFEYIGVAFIPALWMMFVIHFIERGQWLRIANIVLIFLIPAITFLMVITNEYHYLHYTSVSEDASGPFPLLAIEAGPWYTIHTIFFYALMALGMFLLLWHFKRFDAFYRKQTIIILTGAMVPWITNLVYLLGIRPHAHIDLTPYAFILTALIIAFGLTRYKLFNIVPYAREKLIENLREGMIILDERGRIIDFNAAMLKFPGLEQSLIGKTLQEVLPDSAELQRLQIEKRQQRIEVEISFLSGIKVYEVSSTPLTNDQKNFAGMLLAFWDITARKQTTELLTAQAKELQELNDLKSRMFSIIAHDLKSPMAGLLGVLKLAESGMYNETELKNIFPLLTRNVDNIRLLMDNLLNWARSQLQGSYLQPELFDIHGITSVNERLFEKRLLEKSVTLVNEVREGTMVYADQAMMDLVIRNLVENAIKFCDAGGTITVRALMDDRSTMIQVADTGVGMNEFTQATLFQLMGSVRTGTKNEKGTGLGLALCKDFIEKNGGRIWVDSEVGAGSIFYVQVPSSNVN